MTEQQTEGRRVYTGDEARFWHAELTGALTEAPDVAEWPEAPDLDPIAEGIF